MYSVLSRPVERTDKRRSGLRNRVRHAETMENSCATYNNYRKSSKDQICCSDATDVPCRSVCLAGVVGAVAVHVRLRRRCIYMPESCLKAPGSQVQARVRQPIRGPHSPLLIPSAIRLWAVLSSFSLLLLPFCFFHLSWPCAVFIVSIFFSFSTSSGPFSPSVSYP